MRDLSIDEMTAVAGGCDSCMYMDTIVVTAFYMGPTGYSPYEPVDPGWDVGPPLPAPYYGDGPTGYYSSSSQAVADGQAVAEEAGEPVANELFPPTPNIINVDSIRTAMIIAHQNASQLQANEQVIAAIENAGADVIEALGEIGPEVQDMLEKLSKDSSNENLALALGTFLLGKAMAD